MQFYNKEEREIPVLHFCGKSRKAFKEVFSDVKKQAVIMPDNLTVITFSSNNISNVPPLIKQLEKSDIAYVNAAEGVNGWSNALKPKLAVAALKNIQTEYVLLLDSLDIALTQAFTEIIDRYKEYGYEILFGACKERFPNTNIEKVFNRDGLGCFNQINTGTCIGSVEAVKDFYQAAVDMNLIKNKFGSEQYMLRYVFEMFQYDVTYDYNCTCFQTFIRAKLTPMKKDVNKFIVS